MSDIWPNLAAAARDAQLSYWTMRRYAERGVFVIRRDEHDRIECEPEAPAKARAHYLANGGPGGRPVLA